MLWNKGVRSMTLPTRITPYLLEFFYLFIYGHIRVLVLEKNRILKNYIFFHHVI